MELPAEGSGLRGKDENDDHQVADAEQAGAHQQQPSTSAASARPAGSGPSATTTSIEGSHAAVAASNPLNPPPARKLCIRHQRMADEGTVGKLQRVSERFVAFQIPSPSQVASHLKRPIVRHEVVSAGETGCWLASASSASSLTLGYCQNQLRRSVQFEALMYSTPESRAIEETEHSQHCARAEPRESVVC